MIVKFFKNAIAKIADAFAIKCQLCSKKTQALVYWESKSKVICEECAEKLTKSKEN